MRRWFLIGLLLAAAPAMATGAPSVLGGEGEIYRVLRGEQGQIFPNGPPATASNPVLALEIVRVGGAVERQLVPGSEGEANENYPAVALDQATNTVFVVWEAQLTIHSTLHLAAFASGEWSDVFELSGNPFSTKLNPRLAATTEQYQTIDDSGTVVTSTRTLLHLVWWDESGAGERALYAALRVEDGAFVPDWRVLELPSLLPEDDSGSATQALPQELYRSPQVRSTSAGGSVVVAFAEPASGRLAAVDIRPVSGTLIHLADRARVEIVAIGQTVGDRHALAEAARIRIVEIGRRLTGKEVAEFLAAGCAAFLAASDPLDSVEDVAEQARVQIIDLGVQLARGPRMPADKGRVQIIDIGRDTGVGSRHLAALKIGSVKPAPAALDPNAHLMVSDDGEDLALAWDLGAAVNYRQADASSWSETRVLTIDEHLTRDEAYQLLTKRLQQ